MHTSLIFDFDGVLGLSDVPRFNALKELCAARGLELTDDHFPLLVGKASDIVLPQIFPLEPAHTFADIIDEYRREHKGAIERHVEPVATTVEFIKAYEGNLTLAVASMNSTESLERLTAHFGIREKLSAIVSRNDVTHHKPDPEVYLKTAERLGVDPGTCLVVEDTALGASAALAAGMQCHILLNGYNAPEEFEGLAITGFINGPDDMERFFGDA